MDAERWRQIDDLFHRLLAAAPAQREEALRRAAGDDEELREELASLLAAHDAGAGEERWSPGAAVGRLASDLLGRDGEGAEPAIGETLGRFRLLDLLGVGGMGAVYRAFDPELRRIVAVKVLAPHVADPEHHRRALQEARAASALRHPAIAVVHEIGSEGETPFIVMECVEGETLARRLADGALPVHEALAVALQVVEALAEAHRRGIVHRDVKAANVMLTSRGGVKVLDFGLAARAPAPGEAPAGGGAPMGTPAAMSPEQAVGAAVDRRTDVFSVGVLLHHMLSGQPPFVGASVGETMGRLLSAPPPPLPDGVPPPVRRLVARCLSKEPEGRYASAEELLAELRAAAGAAVAAGRSSRRPRGVRRLAVAGAFAGVAAAVAGGLLLSGSGAVERSTIRSIAVLPLADLSPPPREAYFADGLTEALITEMTRVHALRVIARSSAMAFRDVQRPASAIADRLDVDALLTGSVLRTASGVRVSVRLVHGASEELLWAESYQRTPSDILVLQGEIARAVAREVHLRLTPADESRLGRSAPIDPLAYESYLRGRYFWNQRSEHGLEKAIAAFEDAIRRSPRYPLAHAGLADCFALLGPYGSRPPEDTYPRAEAAARRALVLDPLLGEAHATLGLVAHEYAWDHAAAERSYRRAIELAPSYATARQWYAEMLTRLGRHQEARRQIAEAQRLDPLSLIVNAIAGWVDLHAGRPEAAAERLRSTLDLDPGFVPAWSYLGLAAAARGRFEQAIAAHREALRLSGRAPRQLADLAITLAEAGETGEARALLAELEDAATRKAVPALHFAGIYLALGDPGRALDLLTAAADERGVWMLFLKVDRRFTALRGEPRFEDLLARTGLLSSAPHPATD